VVREPVTTFIALCNYVFYLQGLSVLFPLVRGTPVCYLSCIVTDAVLTH
jgi:hypothetical protein